LTASGFQIPADLLSPAFLQSAAATAATTLDALAANPITGADAAQPGNGVQIEVPAPQADYYSNDVDMEDEFSARRYVIRHEA